MSPDGMHTLADFISHLMEMLSGKYNTPKVQACEKHFTRFPDIWPKDCDQDTEQPKKKRKVDGDSKPSGVDMKTPWSLSKEQVKVADERARNISYTHSEDITPGPHFSKLWTLRTMNSKIQFVTSGALEWCIHGLLPPLQEKTLKKVCFVLKRMVSPEVHVSTLHELQEDTHEAFSLLERDFPLVMQNLTTHLIHHVVDDLGRFGPMYGRWLFPYERANAWITRQCLRKGMEESTVMETYVIYDWCIYMILSQKFKPTDVLGDHVAETSERIMEQLMGETSLVSSIQQRKTNTRSLLTESMKEHMIGFYRTHLEIGLVDFMDFVMEIHGAYEMTDNSGRRFKIVCDKYRGNKPCSVVKITSKSDNQFGRISFLLEHGVNGTLQYWALVQVFPLAERIGTFFCVEDNPVQQKLVHFSLLSKPLVHVQQQVKLYILRDY